MKKLATLLLVSISIVTIAGCSSQKAYENENTSETVQVDNTKGTDEISEIDEKSAQQLVSERLDTTVYSVEKEDDITVDEQNYYVFKVLQDGNALSMGVAVNKVSGELFAYKEDKTIAPYSEFTLYDESQDSQVNWDDTYESETASLVLLPADANSFEFTLTSKEGNFSVTGVAQAEGKEAVYEEESGYKVTFTNEGDSITVAENTANASGVSFDGTYTK
ncbi:hypothetical protein [Konateibacter massiliensis]|uniref:hypothetical protein n=1 Tax=Konateibacter massiliensis TaxID=2002841 RepID=UPI000C15000A|nr:hypothetical protein [Konateibacter massiliensis]